ncbi:MAG: aldehyde dehydrogenase [Patescibacteria group bacterium]|jgi:acyl-CoA reductase-like NAD-dependent aldehyde dehydrogenase
MEIKSTLEKQRIFFASQQTKSVSFRLEKLAKLRSAILAYEESLVEALFKDLHRSKAQAYYLEIGGSLREISYAIKHLKKWAKPQRKKSEFFWPLAKNYIIPEPYGVSLIIAPWNYPLQLLIAPLVGAIAAGNCAVLKPSEISGNTAAVIKQMFDEFFPDEYIKVILGGAETTQDLLKEQFDYIFFTGGEVVGKIVMQAAAQNLTPLTLELGGKSPCIVDKDCDLKKAAKRIAFGKFLNCGQTCIAPDYLLVDRAVKESLIAELQKAVEKFFTVNPRESKEYGRIINSKHHERLVSYLNEGKVLYGGENNAHELFIAPTLISDVSVKSRIMQEEIFGPILPIMEYDNLNQAIYFITSRPKPLALYVFSNNVNFQERILHETSSGGACINDTLVHLTPEELSFGGVGASGFGKYHGRASFELFSNQKSVMRQTNLIDLPLRYPPIGSWSLKIIKKIMK